jgi:hypothetical protein
MVFIEPSIFTQIGGSQPTRRSKQLDYELESKSRGCGNRLVDIKPA